MKISPFHGGDVLVEHHAHDLLRGVVVGDGHGQLRVDQHVRAVAHHLQDVRPPLVADHGLVLDLLTERLVV